MWGLKDDPETTAGGDPRRDLVVGFGGFCRHVTESDKYIVQDQTETGQVLLKDTSFSLKSHHYSINRS